LIRQLELPFRAIGENNTMITLSPETEALVRAKAAAAGKTPEELIHDALAKAGAVLPWRRPTTRPRIDTKEEFVARLDEIARRSAARPVVDPRSPDEIIGYDDFGLPR
jgi:antitoxin VapB